MSAHIKPNKQKQQESINELYDEFKILKNYLDSSKKKPKYSNFQITPIKSQFKSNAKFSHSSTNSKPQFSNQLISSDKNRNKNKNLNENQCINRNQLLNQRYEHPINSSKILTTSELIQQYQKHYVYSIKKVLKFKQRSEKKKQSNSSNNQQKILNGQLRQEQKKVSKRLNFENYFQGNSNDNNNGIVYDNQINYQNVSLETFGDKSQYIPPINQFNIKLQQNKTFGVLNQIESSINQVLIGFEMKIQRNFDQLQQKLETLNRKVVKARQSKKKQENTHKTDINQQKNIYKEEIISKNQKVQGNDAISIGNLNQKVDRNNHQKNKGNELKQKITGNLQGQETICRNNQNQNENENMLQAKLQQKDLSAKNSFKRQDQKSENSCCDLDLQDFNNDVAQSQSVCSQSNQNLIDQI